MEFVKLNKDQDIATITISKPEALNALNSSVLSDLDRVLDEVEKDSKIRCVIVTGEGEKAFVAGADIKEIRDLNTDQALEFARKGQSVFSRIENLKVPVIAAGRISTPARVESILQAKKADLVGLARVLWVDPQWPQKASKGQDRGILYCSPKCDACMQLVMQGKPAFCPKWSKQKRAAYRGLFQ